LLVAALTLSDTKQSPRPSTIVCANVLRHEYGQATVSEWSAA
jgi:hypothetical protein